MRKQRLTLFPILRQSFSFCQLKTSFFFFFFLYSNLCQLEQSSGTMWKHYFLSRNNTSTWKKNDFKKSCSRETKLAITHYFFLVKIFAFQEKLLFPLKGFLASPTYRRCVKVVFRKSALAFLGPTSTAYMTLSKAISATQSFLPQVSG